ncbi:RNA polymerase sigma factor (sigma-70 family) [Kibdelosporangium banguiense]|uniref:RNA polymerase sigma factor (Sigma-70 family) n=1 Tax=Kibdelosporangium banguiense TaxID=1365924 RepID=A0ABS4TFW5_9PSEU|nr:sigma-70 family RNA polymerase sigma factor [Kibdelosporangium banguiense]MBP2323312.1 RNA polymerase sigma factor (sigma-70 family) [Kibdelosporangium banguiense]
MQNYTNVDTTEIFLSPEAQYALISAAQDVPCTVITDATGNETVAFGKTRKSEAALTRLVQSFTPLIRSMARTATRLDYDEAEAICYARFMQAVREFDLDSDVPFSRDIRTMLRYELSDKSRTKDLIQVKENVAARYFRLLRQHDRDVKAAYEVCRTTPNGLDPSTFLAVHRAYGHVVSLDLAMDGDENSDDRHEAFLIDHMAEDAADDLANRDLIRWAFSKVSDREEQILRLRYGFVDVATENIRSAAGFRSDTSDPVMSDREVAQCLGLALSSCNRYRRDALATMRAALESLVADGE